MGGGMGGEERTPEKSWYPRTLPMTDPNESDFSLVSEARPSARRRAVLILLLLAVFLILTVFLQEREWSWFSTWAPYRIRRDQLLVTRPPEWVPDDIPARLFEDLVRRQRGETVTRERVRAGGDSVDGGGETVGTTISDGG
ncbi:MAG: hypothetical protein Q4C47_07615, partial [Planctomycetia bacterium]|nr:hypothetical protein [Planctomycetia bacterium]